MSAAIEIQNGSLTRLRVCVADSVFEDTTVIVRDDWLHIEFDAGDLENVSLNLRDLAEQEALQRKEPGPEPPNQGEPGPGSIANALSSGR